jgi:hypothetical protein
MQSNYDETKGVVCAYSNNDYRSARKLRCRLEARPIKLVVDGVDVPNRSQVMAHRTKGSPID